MLPHLSGVTHLYVTKPSEQIYACKKSILFFRDFTLPPRKKSPWHIVVDKQVFEIIEFYRRNLKLFFIFLYIRGIRGAVLVHELTL